LKHAGADSANGKSLIRAVTRLLRGQGMSVSNKLARALKLSTLNSQLNSAIECRHFVTAEWANLV
jgi:isocitrate dehydrogenase